MTIMSNEQAGSTDWSHRMAIYQGEGENTDVPAPRWQRAETLCGVSMLCPWEDPYAGFPEHGRRLASALAGAGVTTHLRSINASGQFTFSRDPLANQARRDLEKDLAPLLNATMSNTMARIVHTVGDPGTLFRLGAQEHPLFPREDWRKQQRVQIVSTVFERDHLRKDVVAALKNLGGLWVASTTDHALLSGYGLKVWRVPMPIMPGDPHLALRYQKRLAGPPHFYHIGKWEPRKEQRNILLAFMLAFAPGEATLTMRTGSRGPQLPPGSTYPRGYQAAFGEILEMVRVKDRGWNWDNVSASINVITKRLPADVLLQLHRQGDIYVTLSRGEGWDMPAFDAAISGNRLVYTPSGGPQDFAAPTDFAVPSCGKVPCDPLYGWGDDAHYMDYEIDDAVSAMQAAAIVVNSDPCSLADDWRDEVEKSGSDVACRIRNLERLDRMCSLEAVGRILRDSVCEVSQLDWPWPTHTLRDFVGAFVGDFFSGWGWNA